MSDPRIIYDLDTPPGLTWARAADVLVHARDLLTFITARFGTPLGLAALSSIVSRRKAELLGWLRPVELMLRRLVLIEAMALLASLVAPRSHSRKQASNASPKPPQTSALDPADSAAWRSIFTVPLHEAEPGDAQSSRASGHRRRRIDDPERLLPTRGLALRLEGIIRVALDPTPFIRRLARQMRRRMPKRIDALLRPLIVHRGAIRQDLGELAAAAAESFARINDTS
ncbi:MAG: hypothetical protein Q8R82_08550 [Hyphomonadaceae bacterium]|nr:hypothetical protein [Hyphomonadaceae bacterium]